MDSGSMVEFDHPYNLLKNKDGFFYNMVAKTGRDNADFLHSAAKKVLLRPLLNFYIKYLA